MMMPLSESNSVPILAADDDPQDVMLLEIAIRRSSLNIRLQTVADGEQAIDYLMGRGAYTDREAHPFPKLLLLDLKMPRMTGFEVLSFVRGQSGLRQLPVIIFSSSDDPRDIRKAYDSGANSYLCKPHSNDGLLDLLSALREYWLKHNHFPPCC